MNYKYCFTPFALIILASSFTLPIQAGQIAGFTWSSAVASIALDPVAPPVASNNDNVVGISPNGILVTQKAYNGIGPADIVFFVEPSGGVTEYYFMEGVDNMTSSPWSSYRMELGFGVGSGFTLSPPGDGLDFDAPDFDTPADFTFNFPTLSESEDVLVASGGTHSNVLGFSFANYFFSIDVPDGISEFTLRQIPIAEVPEPSSLIMAACCGVALLRTRRNAR